jgi:hypothetical protein
MQIVGPKKTLSLYQRTEGDASADGQAITWSETPISFKGILAQLSGYEKEEYQRMNISVKYKLFTNKLGIKEKDKIIFGGNTYDVRLVDNRFDDDKILVVLLDVHNKEV